MRIHVETLSEVFHELSVYDTITKTDLKGETRMRAGLKEELNEFWREYRRFARALGLSLIHI